MTKKRTGKQGAKKNKVKKKSESLAAYLTKVGVGILILIVLVIGGLGLADYFFSAPSPKKIKASKNIPTYEVYPEEQTTPERVIPEPSPVPIPHPDRPLPRTAIIIDDIGYDKAMADNFLKFNEPITMSLLPYGPYTRKIAKQAADTGIELMLHLPMEPKEYPSINPGPGGLLTSMSPDELIAQLGKDIHAVPGIKGVNNHMGSKMTADSAQMNQIFTILKSKKLYFVDSLTSSESVGKSSARLFKLAYEERDVFIDHIQDPDFISGQIERLMRIAEKYGTSVGIAHPHEVTYQVMDKMMPEIKKRVQIVPVSQLVHEPG